MPEHTNWLAATKKQILSETCKLTGSQFPGNVLCAVDYKTMDMQEHKSMNFGE